MINRITFGQLMSETKSNLGLERLAQCASCHASTAVTSLFSVRLWVLFMTIPFCGPVRKDSEIYDVYICFC